MNDSRYLQFGAGFEALQGGRCGLKTCVGSGRAALWLVLLRVALGALLLAAPKTVLAQVQTSSTGLQVTVSGVPVSSVAAGAPVKLTASVTSGGTAVHLGTVNFCDAGAVHCTNAALLGSAQLTSSGTASIVIRLASGSRRVEAVFVGSKTYGGSTSLATGLTVTGARPATTSIGLTGVQGNYSLTGTVTSTAGPGSAPSGSLSFQDTSNGSVAVATGSLIPNANIAGLTLTSSAATPSGGAIVAADLNGDGLPDLVVPQQVQTYKQGYPLTILLSKGDGTFTTLTTPLVPQSVVEIADFNNDGIPDIFCASFEDGTYTVLLGKGDGTFTAGAGGSALLGYGAQAVLGDFNGDGNLDVAVVTSNGVLPLLGNGDGSFTAQANQIPITQFQVTIVGRDFNGDGLTDLALADASANTVTVYLSQGDGTFKAKATYATGNQPAVIVTSDFNNDGFADLATSNEQIGTVTVLLGNGDGSFTAAPLTAPVPGATATSNGVLGTLAVADLNGDGIPDLFSPTSSANTAQVLLGKGDGSFQYQAAMPTIVSGGGTSLVAFGDFNGDGAVDLAALDQNVNITRILLNHIQSSATVTVTGVAVAGAGTHAVDAVYPGDMVYSGSTSGTVTLDVPQTATAMSLTAFPAVAAYGRQVVFTAKLAPSSMGTITTAGETVTFYNAGAAIGTGLLTNGVATFSTSVLAIGTSPISASYAGDATFLASTSATLNFMVSAPGAPTVTSLAATVNGAAATSATAGASITYTATVLANGVPLHAGQVMLCNSSAAFCLGSNVLGMASLTGNGTAAIKLRFGVGAHGVRAVFAGTQNYMGSSSPVSSVMVTGLQPSAATLAVSGSTGAYLLTATITGSGLATGPTGTLTFLDTSNGNSPVGTAVLGGGTLTRSFVTIASPATGATPAGIVTADFNNDGIPDFATINSSSGTSANTVTLLLGTGTGTTTTLPAVGTGGTGGLQLVAGDFNGDGAADLAVLSAQGPVAILLGNGDGTFTAHNGPTINGPLAMAAADLDGDGILDLAISTSVNTVIVAHGNGDGTFTPLSATTSTGSQPVAIAVGDFNHDGTPDLAVANLADSTISLLLGNGDGTFAVQAATLSTGSHPAAILALDANSDGLIDLVTANQNAATCSVFLGTSSGGFTSKPAVACGSTPAGLATMDFNGDGVPDLTVANNVTPGKVTILTGNGDGTFTASTVVPAVGNGPIALVSVDANADGIPDLAVANSGSATVSVALGQLSENATATLGSRLVVNNGVVTMGGGLEIPGAGIHAVDVLFAGDSNYSGSTSATVALNGSQTPTTLVLQSSSPLSSYGQTVTFTAALSPYAVDAATTNGETITFNDAGAAIGSAVLNNGVASFSLNTLGVGLHSITATYAGDTNFVTSTSAPATPARVLNTRAVTSTVLSVVSGGVSVATITQGTQVTLTATVMGAGQPAFPGTVSFCSATAASCTGTAMYGSAQVTSSGVARLVLRPGKGGYQYVARFAGDNSFASSASAAVSLSVPANSTTTMAATGMPGNYTLSATVAGSGSLNGPAGTVSFLDTTNANATFATSGLGTGKLTQAFMVQTANLVPSPGAIGDFNNDGLPDFLYGQGGLSVGTATGPFGVSLNNGDGTYTNKVISPTSTSPSFIVGDFNNDGNLDFALLNVTVLNLNAGTTASTIQIYLGRGDGTFAAQASVSLPITSVGAAVADLNNDGNLDIAFSSSSPLEAYVLLGNGDGTFTAAATQTALNGADLTPIVADFNRDGIPDLAWVEVNQVRLLLGNGDGTFTSKVSSAATPYVVNGGVSAVADFNGDGIPDLAVPEYLTGSVTTLLGNGDGSFRLGVTTPSIVAETQTVVATDLNGDGFADVAVTDGYHGYVDIYYGNGDGTLGAATIVSAAASGAFGLFSGDFNGDGLPDLLTFKSAFTGNATTPITVLSNSASFTATAMATGVSVPGIGIHYVDASYPGSSSYVASISSTIPLTAEPPTPPAIPAAATVLTLSVNPVEGTYQQPVILTAVLSPSSLAGASTNGETVNFLRNNVILGTATLMGGVATYTTSTLPGGASQLSAAYNGDANFAASVSGSTSLLVAPASAVTTLTVTAGGQTVGSVAAGTLVTLSVGVAHGATPVAAALVNLCDASYVTCIGPGLLGTVQVAAGSASMKIRFAAGTHRINAQLVPQANYSTSVSLTSTLTVTGSGASATTLAAAGQQGAYTLTATTTGFSRTTASTGAVAFYDVTRGNALLGSAALGAGTLARTFVPQPSIILQNYPSDTVTADFNGDGIPDVAVLTEFTYQLTSVTILLGDGKGGLTAMAPIEFGFEAGVTATARSLAVGDFNHDGVPDLAVGVAPGMVAVLLGAGNGTFTQAAPLVVGQLSANVLQSAVAVADFNGDGIADIFAIPISNLVGSAPVVFPGHGDGTFGAPIGASSVNTGALIYQLAFAVGDFNGDGVPDYALSTPLPSGSPSNNINIFFGKGDGTFSASPQNPITVTNPSDMQTGDFNGDGILDLVVATSGSSKLTILLGKGDGTFTFAASPSVTANVLRVTTADFNNDGIEDLAVTQSSSSSSIVTVLLGNGDGTFSRQGADVAAGSYAYGTVAADFNGDGQSDIVITNFNSDSISVLLNQLTETTLAYLPGARIVGAGVHQVNAVYPGDATFAASTSNVLMLNGVAATSTAVSLTASAASSNYGASVILTATLAPTGAPATNGESITFSSGGTVLGTASLANGLAVLTTTALPAGNDSVTASYPGDSTYASAVSNAAGIAVAQAASTITYVPATGQTYGVPAGGAGILNATGTPGGGTATYTASGANGAVALNASSVLPVGVYTLTATYIPADATDYAGSSKTVAGYVVSRATPGISWNVPASIPYGTQLSGTQLNASSTVAGSFAYSSPAGTVLEAGPHSITAMFTPTDMADYSTATATVTLQVNQATPPITWQTPGNIAYGTALNATQLNASSTVPGTFAYTPPAGTILSAGSHTLQTTFTPADSVNYTTASTSVTLVVGQAAPTITWPAPAPISYGTALSAVQLDASAGIPGTYTYTPALGATLHAGPQTLSVTFTPTDSVTYGPATASVVLQVMQAASSITWAPPAPIVYGTALSGSQLNATSGTNGSFSYTPGAGAILSAGTHALSVTFTPMDAIDFTSATASVMLQVTQAVPVITWPTPSPVVYGTSLSAAQLNATANVPGTFTYQPAAGTAFSMVGAQTLTATFVPTDSTDYAGAMASVSLQVTQAPPTVSWLNPSAIIYGTALSAAQLNATASVPGTFVYSPAAGTILPAGMQSLKATFTPANAALYASATATSTLMVSPAVLTITAANASRVYGAANPAFTYTANGFVSADTAAVLSGSPAETTSATTASTPGSYSIVASPGSLAASNYTFTFANGSLTVSQAASVTLLTFSATPVPLGSPETITIAVSSATSGVPSGSVVLSDGMSTLGTLSLTNGQAQFSTSSLSAGSHAITAAYAGDGDFVASQASGTLSVSAMPADFTFSSSGASSQSVLPGLTSTFSFALAPMQSGYPSAISFTVAGLPSGASASFSPASVAIGGGAQTVVMTVQTPASFAALRRDTNSKIASCMAFAMLLLPFGAARRIRGAHWSMMRLVVLLLLSASFLAGLTGCGSGNGYFGQSPHTYPLMVTASGGGVQHSLTVNLTIE